jgi:hypothetical protein
MTTLLAPLGEYEVEDEAHEDEWEQEGELETAYHEDEDEAEEFFGALASLASSALRNPALRRIGLSAARSALSAGGRALSGQTGGASNQVAGWLQGLLPMSEMEAELEGEDFADPYRRVYPNRGLMEHVGHLAAETEDEDEAEAFIGSLVPLAAKAAPALLRAAPHLTRAVSTVGRQLRANPSTRPLVRVLPSIVQRTAHTVNRQAAAGHRITPHRAVRTLARHTARTLSNPRQLVRDYRRSQTLEHRHHLRSGHPATHVRRHPGAPHTYGYGRRHVPSTYGPARVHRPAAYGPASYGPAPYGPARPTQAHAHPHTHPSGVTHNHTHTHAHASTPARPGGSYGPAPTAPPRRYAPAPGVLPPPRSRGTYAGPGTGTWTCTCQWA